MQPNLTDATIEYIFTPNEIIAAKQLDPIKIAWIQTRYAQTFKKKAAMQVPADKELIDVFHKEMIRLDATLDCLQEFIDDHKQAVNDLNQAKLAQEEAASTAADEVAKRASELVNKP